MQKKKKSICGVRNACIKKNVTGYILIKQSVAFSSHLFTDSFSADVPSPVKFHHQQRSSPYPSPVMGHVASRISAVNSSAASTPRSAMARRNERERKRVRLVNHGFATLRQYLPQSNNSRKKVNICLHMYFCKSLFVIFKND